MQSLLLLNFGLVVINLHLSEFPWTPYSQHAVRLWRNKGCALKGKRLVVEGSATTTRAHILS